MIYSTQGPAPEDVGGFLKESVQTGSTEEQALSRSKCSLVPSDRFIIKERNFSRQYAHLYAGRLMFMRQRLSEAAQKKWGDKIPERKLHNLKSDEQCIVIGTLFKNMELRPSILKEIAEETNLMPQPILSRYTKDNDQLIMEDELQRIILVGGLECKKAVTGILVAVLGVEPENDRGKFHVTDFCFQDLPAQVPRPEIGTDKYILFASGFELGGVEERSFQMQQLADLVTGHLGDVTQQTASSQICHVVIAGNCLSSSTQDRDSLTKAKYLSKKISAGSVEAIKTLDNFLAQLTASVDVSVLPGEYDPSNYTLPQQPFHHCMLPLSSQVDTLHCQTNPCELTLEGIKLIGTSGQPINNICSYSEIDDRIEALESTLMWGHLAPTAPDTLGCYPYTNGDPFILSDCPHIYFAGCQTDFHSKIHKGPSGQEVLLLTVPRFSQSGTVVLVNLRTLEAQPVSFHGHFPVEEDSESPEVDK